MTLMLGPQPRLRHRRSLLAAAAIVVGLTACIASAGGGAQAGPGDEITIGTLYAGSGSFAASSGPQLAGLKFWIHQVNAVGGVYVGALHRKQKVRLAAYDDHSSPAMAAVLYGRLLSHDRVSILVSDFGSVLTQPAVGIAQQHGQLLFDPTGSGAGLFSPANPYIVLTSVPTSAVWPSPLCGFIVARHISRVAIIYAEDLFDRSQEQTIAARLTRAAVAPVTDISVPLSTTGYRPLIRSVLRFRPQAVLELGYQNNDIGFLRDLRSSAVHFPMVFTIFPGQLTQLLQRSVGTAGLAYTFSYGFPPEIAYTHVTMGMTTARFVARFRAATHSAANFLDIAGYNAGLVIQAALRHATALSQLGLRSALNQVSGRLGTLEGRFKIDSMGAQTGERLPVAQILPTDGTAVVKAVYPPGQAQVPALYPVPK